MLKKEGGYTALELIIVIGMIGVLSLSLYYKGASRHRISRANFTAMSNIMENIAQAVEGYYWQNGTVPPDLAATDYTPPDHPFGGTYGFQVDIAKRTVRVTSTFPKGTGRAIGPWSNVVPMDATWDRAEIFKPFTTDGDWNDKKTLYGE